MHSSARCRLVEISHFSFGDCFAALQIDLCVRGWIGAFTTLAAYTIPISSQTMSFPADSTDENLRQPPLPKTRRIVALPPSESNHFFRVLRFDNCPWDEYDA